MTTSQLFGLSFVLGSIPASVYNPQLAIYGVLVAIYLLLFEKRSI